MRHLFSLTVGIAAILHSPPGLVWGQGVAGRDYPAVYGSTGGLYGPTQVPRQYPRQYGRGWHGDHGLAGGPGGGAVNRYPGGGSGHGHHGHRGNNVGVDVLVPGYGLWGPAGYGWNGPWGYQGYDPGSSAGYHVVPSPVMPWASPAVNGPPGAPGAVSDDALGEDRERASREPEDAAPARREMPEPPQDSAPRLPPAMRRPVDDEVMQASFEKEKAGDKQLKLGNYAAAAEQYREAVRLVEDRPEPRFRLAIAETSQGNFEEAVHELKTLYRVHPEWAMRAPTLDMLYGENGLLAKTLVQEGVISWVKEDLRDPDRLFLMGVVLYYDNQFERAETVLAAAARLNGPKPHLRSLLATMTDVPPPVLGATDAGPKTPAAADDGGLTSPPLPEEPAAGE